MQCYNKKEIGNVRHDNLVQLNVIRSLALIELPRAKICFADG